MSSILFVNSEIQVVMNVVIGEMKRMNYDISVRTLSVIDLSSVIDEMNNIVLCVDLNTHKKAEEIHYIVEKAKLGGKQIMMVGTIPALQSMESMIPKEVLGMSCYDVGVRDVINHIEANVIKEPLANTNVVVEEEGVRHKVMIVDDSGAMLLSVKRWLEPKYQVIMMNSAAQAERYMDMKHDYPDLMLLDMEMPNENGISFLKRLRENPLYRNLNVIFLTNNNSQNDITSAIELKPQGYILKSLNQKSIVERIDAFFEEK